MIKLKTNKTSTKGLKAKIKKIRIKAEISTIKMTNLKLSGEEIEKIRGKKKKGRLVINHPTVAYTRCFRKKRTRQCFQ